MTNFYDILKNVCTLAHEDLPYDFSSEESPYNEIKQYIKNITEEVCSIFPWTFRERKLVISTVAGQREYDLSDGTVVSNIVKNGVRINDSTEPLYFVFHNDLDRVQMESGKPYRYSAFAEKLVLDPVPDGVYNIQIKYLTTNYALSADKTTLKPNLELEDDVSIIPDRFIKVVEWGAYSLYRQNLNPDEKYKFAKEKYLQYLIDMQKQDNYGGDDFSKFIMGNETDYSSLLIKQFFDPRV